MDRISGAVSGAVCSNWSQDTIVLFVICIIMTLDYISCYLLIYLDISSAFFDIWCPIDTRIQKTSIGMAQPYSMILKRNHTLMDYSKREVCQYEGERNLERPHSRHGDDHRPIKNNKTNMSSYNLGYYRN